MVGIAIINYKTYQKTIECIDSIRENLQIPYKIYLLDNGSGNESAEVLRFTYENASDVRLIIEEKNHGYARGNNICIGNMRQDGCKIGIISNNDIICTPDSIQNLVKDLEENKGYLLVGPKILNHIGLFQKSVKVRKYSEIEYLKKSTYFARFFKKECMAEEEEIKTIKNLTIVDWVSGAFFAFDVEKFAEIGDFDPTTFLFFEEYILADKAAKKGYLLGYDPQAVVYHYHAYSTGGGMNINTKIAADRSERYYMKTYSSFGWFFLSMLEGTRLLEVLFTFGKRKEWHNITKYLKEVKVPLK